MTTAERESAARRRKEQRIARAARKSGLADGLPTAALADALAAAAPAGWTVVRGRGWTDGVLETSSVVFGCEHVIFRRPIVDGGPVGPWAGCAVALNVAPLPVATRFNRYVEESAYRGCSVEGHTIVDGRSFTRLGVDVASCGLRAAESRRFAHDYGDIAALLAGEYHRCVDAAKRSQTAVEVPGLPFRVQPDWFARAAETLRRGAAVVLTPSGFGTGYALRTRRGSGAPRRAAAALEALLDVGPVFVESFDHD